MSVHGMPPRDEPFDPRQAALAHAGFAGELVGMGRVSAEVGRQNARQDRILAELANAVACGLVYIGDSVRLLQQVDAGPVEVMFESTAALVYALERIRDHEEHMGSGPPDDEMREIARAALEGTPDETARWREFLRDQAAQIPEGVESSLRELLAQLEGQSLEFELREPVQSLTDWLNQLSNVRREVRDGGAGES